MKKSFLIQVICIVVFTNLSIAQTNSIKVSSTGYVGINVANPTYQLHLSGTSYLGGAVTLAASGYTIYYGGASIYPTGNVDMGSSGHYWYRLYATTPFFTYTPVITSDINYKSNISSLSLMIDKIKLLRPVSYNLKGDDKKVFVDPAMNSTQFGFIAQEMQDVFPELVTKRDDGVLGISYTQLIPILVQAIKEQQEKLDILTKRVTELEQKIK